MECSHCKMAIEPLSDRIAEQSWDLGIELLYHVVCYRDYVLYMARVDGVI